MVCLGKITENIKFSSTILASCDCEDPNLDKNLIWTKIFSDRRGSQTASVTYEIKMKETFLSRNLRFANSTQWGKAGRGIGLGGGAAQTPPIST